jgi:hypothetical protein
MQRKLVRVFDLVFGRRRLILTVSDVSGALVDVRVMRMAKK